MHWKPNKMRKYLWVFGVMLLLSLSCEDERCSFSTNTDLQLGLYVGDESLNVDSIRNLIAVTNASWTDTIWYKNTDGNGKFGIPLSPERDSSVFIFIRAGEAEKLTVRYDTELVLLSTACGFVPFFSNLELSYTGNNIDSLQWVSREVTNDEQEDLKIYL